MGADPAYLAALKLLARRELSEAQLRQRLTRRGYEAGALDEAIARLRREGAIDDLRVAEIIARTEIGVRRRGRLRVKQQIENAGISSAAADQAVQAVSGDLDENALIEASLARRLRGSPRIEGAKQFARLYRYLIGQGFEADQVVRALKARSVK